MIRILITGANSFIGKSFEKYIAQWPDKFHVDTVDMLDGSWREMSFTGYDSVFHVAGIAHQDSGKTSEARKQLYFKVNTNLTVETANKAMAEGVRQFIFMSSIIVYGASAKLGQTKVITNETKPTPKGAYGQSKLKAENGILSLNNESFKVCILRPPMIYGPGCKGNFPLLTKAALKLPFFPDFHNERSMLFVGNLCIFLKAAVVEGLSGLYFPQNSEYVSTSEMVRQIAMTQGRKIRMIKMLNPLLMSLSGRIGLLDKVFGGLVYEHDLPSGGITGIEIPFYESIIITMNNV